MEKNMNEVEIMDASAVSRAIIRIAHEIIENNGGTDQLCIIGIHNRGVPLARRIANIIERSEGVRIPFGMLDIAFYRDDVDIEGLPIVNSTDVPFSVDDKHIVLIDDVIYTGRTARAAMDAMIDMGRPKIIRFAALIDRGHRELPICADFVGKIVPTSRSERVNVKLVETDDVDGVSITK